MRGRGGGGRAKGGDAHGGGKSGLGKGGGSGYDGGIMRIGRTRERVWLRSVAAVAAAAWLSAEGAWGAVASAGTGTRRTPGGRGGGAGRRGTAAGTSAATTRARAGSTDRVRKGQGFEFTVATANLSDNESQAYDGPGIRILKGLKPDIIAIQEFNYRRGMIDDLVRLMCGPGFTYFREKGGARLPNGVISRFPIVAAGQWFDPYVANRNFVWATLAIPGPKRLHVVSVHLVQNRSNRRVPEAKQLLQLVEAQFPKDDYILLCGDFNVNSPDSEVLEVFAKRFEDVHRPVDQLDDETTNAQRNKTYDYVLANTALDEYHVPTVVGGLTFREGLVFDSRLWNPPPPPVRWEDSSLDMQHMPVMKTFRVPLR